MIGGLWKSTSRVALFAAAGVFMGGVAMPSAQAADLGGSFNQPNSDAYFGDARRVAWWIEHKDVGRLTVGRYESAGVVQTIDLGGIGMVASSSFVLLNGSFFLRGPTGQYYAITW